MSEPPATSHADAYRLGSVVYHPKVEQIWALFGEWYADQGLPLEVVYFDDYPAQVAALMAGELDTAWNTNLAHIQVLEQEPDADALAMRDTDRGWLSHLVVRADSSYARLADLEGARVGFGDADSPQAQILPAHALRAQGVDPESFFIASRLDRDVGKHGDTGGAELAQLARVRAGELDASVVSSVVLDAVSRLGDAADLRTVWTSPPFHHCCFTVLPGARDARAERFVELLLGMDAADPKLCEPMELEYVNSWVAFDPSGYGDLIAAVRAGPIVVGADAVAAG
jgi:phosphonate transport system substrate-binding protein